MVDDIKELKQKEYEGGEETHCEETSRNIVKYNNYINSAMTESQDSTVSQFKPEKSHL